MIYTSYFAMIRNMPDNVIPVGISQYPPSWFNGSSLKEVAPPKELLLGYKKGGVTDEEYDCVYKKEVLYKLNVDAFIDALSFLSGVENVATNEDVHVALCCFEKDGDFCHRHLLSDFLNAKGISCREIKKEELLHMHIDDEREL